MTFKLNIYKKGDTKPTFTGNDSDGANITGLAAGTAITAGAYQASHTDDTGALAESDKVDVPAFTVNPAAPAAPKITLTPGDGKIDFNFTKVDGATGYHVWLKKTPDNWTTDPNMNLNANTTSGTFDQAEDGTEYTVAVTAYNTGGESAKEADGASGHVTPAKPKAEAPTNLNSTATDDGAVIKAGK